MRNGREGGMEGGSRRVHFANGVRNRGGASSGVFARESATDSSAWFVEYEINRELSVRLCRIGSVDREAKSR